MELIIILLSIALGLIVGSFLNVVIIRGVKKEKLNGRSHCPFCKTKLSSKELIPIISFLAQKGQCLHCGKKISWQYPLVEGLAGITFPTTIWFFIKNNLWLNFYDLIFLVFLLVGIATAIIIAITDWRFKIIPNGSFLILLLLGLFIVFTRWYYYGFAIAGKDLMASIVLALFFASIWFFSKGQAMGLGDAKLILATSLILGFPASLSAFLFSFWLGGIISLVLLISRAYSLKSELPFGPFILLGSGLAYFFSQSFLNLAGLTQIF